MEQRLQSSPTTKKVLSKLNQKSVDHSFENSKQILINVTLENENSQGSSRSRGKQKASQDRNKSLNFERSLLGSKEGESSGKQEKWPIAATMRQSSNMTKRLTENNTKLSFRETQNSFQIAKRKTAVSPLTKVMEHNRSSVPRESGNKAIEESNIEIKEDVKEEDTENYKNKKTKELREVQKIFQQNQKLRPDQLLFLEKYFSKLKFFKDLIKQQEGANRIVKEAVKYFKYEEKIEGEKVFRLGDSGDKFYIILEGSVQVLIPTQSQKHPGSDSEYLPAFLKHIINEQIFTRIAWSRQPNAELLKAILLKKREQLKRMKVKKYKQLLQDQNLPSDTINEKAQKYAKEMDFHFLEATQEEEQELFSDQEVEKMRNQGLNKTELWLFTQVSTLFEGDCFGELALNSNQPRSATIVCSRDTQFATLNQNEYKKVLEKVMKNILEDKLNSFSEFAFFQKVKRNKLHMMFYQAMPQTAKRGQVLYKVGDPVDGIYLIKEGFFQLEGIMNITQEQGLASEISEDKITKKFLKNKDINVKLQQKRIEHFCGKKEKEQDVKFSFIGKGHVLGIFELLPLFHQQKFEQEQKSMVQSQMSVYSQVSQSKLDQLSTLKRVHTVTATSADCRYLFIPAGTFQSVVLPEIKWEVFRDFKKNYLERLKQKKALQSSVLLASAANNIYLDQQLKQERLPAPPLKRKIQVQKSPRVGDIESRFAEVKHFKKVNPFAAFTQETISDQISQIPEGILPFKVVISEIKKAQDGEKLVRTQYLDETILDSIDESFAQISKLYIDQANQDRKRRSESQRRSPSSLALQPSMHELLEKVNQDNEKIKSITFTLKKRQKNPLLQQRLKMSKLQNLLVQIPEEYQPHLSKHKDVFTPAPEMQSGDFQSLMATEIEPKLQHTDAGTCVQDFSKRDIRSNPSLLQASIYDLTRVPENPPMKAALFLPSIAPLRKRGAHSVKNKKNSVQLQKEPQKSHYQEMLKFIANGSLMKQRSLIKEAKGKIILHSQISAEQPKDI